MSNHFCQLMVAKKLDEIKIKKHQKESKQDKSKVKDSINEINQPYKITTKQ